MTFTPIDFQLDDLPLDWQLTPLGKNGNPKAPYTDDWAKKDLDRDFIQTEIESGKAVGIGLILGAPSGHLVAIDFDGQSAIEMGLELFGELPIVVIDYWLSLLAPKVTTKSRAKTKPVVDDSQTPYTILPIPLKNCLAKSNRAYS